MRHTLFLPALLAMTLFGAAPAQDWDPVKQAVGWSRVDRDGSATFFVPTNQSLLTWMKDGGPMGSLDLSKAGIAPEKWVFDSQGNAWVVSGSTLQQVDKTGKPGKKEVLPAEVGDLAWDAKGFVISYRTLAPYIEKREYKSGNVTWSYGKRPKREDVSPRIQHRIAINEDGNVVVAAGGLLAVNLLDGAKGKDLGQSVFTFNDNAPPNLTLGDGDRGPMAWWLGHGVAFAAVPGAQAPFAKMQGLLLARLDLTNGTVEFLPTGVTEDYVFLGVTDTDAILLNPKGGLAFVPIK